MGQRSQFYIQFVNENRDTRKKETSLCALHLQWSWGDFQIIRTKQVLDYLKEETKYKYSEFTGNGLESANNTRSLLKHLIEFNLLDKTCVRGIDLVLDTIIDKFTDTYKDKENLCKLEKLAIANLTTQLEIPYEVDKSYKINPFEFDNNDGIVVIRINEQGEIKYAFDLLNKNDFAPITAKEYLHIYNEYVEDGDKERTQKVQEMAQEITNNYQLLTCEELKQIFNKEYKW